MVLIIMPSALPELMHPVSVGEALKTLLWRGDCPCGFVAHARTAAVLDATLAGHWAFRADRDCRRGAVELTRDDEKVLS